MHVFRCFALAFIVATAACVSIEARSENWPQRAVKIIVPLPASPPPPVVTPVAQPVLALQEQTLNRESERLSRALDLVRAAPFDVRDYQLDFHTVPAQAIAQVCEVTWQLRGQATGRQTGRRLLVEVLHRRGGIRDLPLVSEDHQPAQVVFEAGRFDVFLRITGDAETKHACARHFLSQFVGVMKTVRVRNEGGFAFGRIAAQGQNIFDAVAR